MYIKHIIVSNTYEGLQDICQMTVLRYEIKGMRYVCRGCIVLKIVN